MIMKEDSLISIIVPIYKVEKYLDRCIDSLVNQTYRNIEIILVDDGSPDLCPQICEDWKNKDERIKVIHQKNKGAAAAKNTGLDMASGKMISFCDADDYMEKSMIETMVHYMHTSQSDIVSCGVNWVDEDGNTLSIKCGDECVLNQPDAIKCLLTNGIIREQVWDKLYKREVIHNVRFVEGKKIDDVFWTYRAIGNARKIAVIKDALYFYTQRSSSVMGAGYQDYWMQTLEAYQKRCDYISEAFPEVYDISVSSLINTCMYHMQMAKLSDRNQKQIEQIQSVVKSKKSEKIYKNQMLKQKVWLWMFVHFPVLTCRIRNKLKKGI